MMFIPPPPSSRQVGRKLGKLLATMRKQQTSAKPHPATPKHNMSTTTQRPTPETDAQCYDCEYQGDMGGKFTASAGKLRPDGDHVPADFARNLERERDEAREQIASCAINTNVRLFDLVRYSRASLHEDKLITDEEYTWLCGGCEMANSPKGGSPSPRRLEDYDNLREQLEAMREAIKEAYQALKMIHDVVNEQVADAVVIVPLGYAADALAKLQPFLKP